MCVFILKIIDELPAPVHVCELQLHEELLICNDGKFCNFKRTGWCS
jgi:hypothetical protein